MCVEVIVCKISVNFLRHSVCVYVLLFVGSSQEWQIVLTSNCTSIRVEGDSAIISTCVTEYLSQ